MDITDILKSEKNKRKKRVGHGPGSGKGKTSGRGQKGQKSRSGSSKKPGFEGGQMPLYRRLPKRGFTSLNRSEYQLVNIGAINAHFAEGTIAPEQMIKKGLINKKKGRVKVLGDGELTKKFVVKAHKFSKSAREKIEANKGKAELLS